MAEVPVATNAPNQRTTRKRPADYTGRLKEQQEAALAAELKAKSRELGMVAAPPPQELDVVIDYTKEGREKARQELVQQPVEVKTKNVKIKVNYPIERMTFGREILEPGNTEEGIPPVMGDLQMWDFEEGPTYEVPRELAEHLERKGYLWGGWDR